MWVLHLFPPGREVRREESRRVELWSHLVCTFSGECHSQTNRINGGWLSLEGHFYIEFMLKPVCGQMMINCCNTRWRKKGKSQRRKSYGDSICQLMIFSEILPNEKLASTSKKGFFKVNLLGGKS